MAASDAPPLTVSVGPRGGEWKRVFNPFRDDSETRFPAAAGIYEPLIMSEAMSGYPVPADATGLAESQKKWKDATLLVGTDWTKRDLAQANRLLDAAGLARGADGVRPVPGAGPMRYEINVVQGWTDWVAAAGIIQQNLAEIGIAASVKPLEYNRWLEALKLGRFDMSLGFGSRGPTPYQFYRGQMDGALVRPVGEEAVDNFHRFASAEAGELLRRFEATADAAEQTEIAHRLERLYVLTPARRPTDSPTRCPS